MTPLPVGKPFRSYTAIDMRKSACVAVSAGSSLKEPTLCHAESAT